MQLYCRVIAIVYFIAVTFGVVENYEEQNLGIYVLRVIMLAVSIICLFHVPWFLFPSFLFISLYYTLSELSEMLSLNCFTFRGSKFRHLICVERVFKDPG